MKIKNILIVWLCAVLFAGCAYSGKEVNMNFKFESLQDNNLIQGSSFFMDFGDSEVMTTEETAILEGKLRTVFGEPWYQSENAENSISYIIKATDSDGKSVILEVYNVGMFHIGAPDQDDFARQAAEALIAYVNTAEPCDYERTIYYLDYFVQMDISVKNGVATVEQSEISEEKADELFDKWWGN